MHTTKKDLGAIIKQFRIDKGYTQDELAEIIGIGPRQLAAIENEESHPRFPRLVKLVRVLDIPAELIFRPEVMTRTPEQEQIINEFLECNSDEQRIIAATMRCLITELRKKI
jgi:transcriptional regulator with XRE-family HTH domain